MKPIKFDFTIGPLTIQWIPQEIRVAKIRTHVDENRMPGPTRYTALIEHYPNERVYELTTLNKSSDAMDGPYLREHRWVIDYMHRNFGAKGMWRRAKRPGDVKVVKNVRGIPLKYSKPEVVKMKEGVLTFSLTNPDGSKFHRSVFEWPNLDKEQVVFLEGKLIAFLVDLNNEAAKLIVANEPNAV